MRRDLQPIRLGDEATIELRLLTDHRVDLVADRTRTTNRLKALLNSMFPAWNEPSTSVTPARWCCWPDTRHRQRSAARAPGG